MIFRLMLAAQLATAQVAPTHDPAPLQGEAAREAFLRIAHKRTPSEHPEAGYRFYEDVLAELAPYVEERSGVVTVEVIGRTVEGRPIFALHIGHPTAPVHDKVLVFANIHAMEWVGTEVATELAVEMIEHPLPGVQLTVIPALNLDARLKVESDLRAGDNRYRRSNANGVDLNRDFAANREAKAVWRHILPRRYTTSPAPLSQPESRAIDRLAAREQYTVAASLHAFGGFNYYPWAGLWERPPDRDTFEQLGKIMEKGQGEGAYRTRQLSRWGFFFRGHGMELDHLYAEYGTYAFLIELTRSGYRSWAHLRQDFRMYNPPDPSRDVDRGVGGLRALIAYLSHPAHTPGGGPPD